MLILTDKAEWREAGARGWRGAWVQTLTLRDANYVTVNRHSTLQ